jgi:hypothetical protein
MLLLLLTIDIKVVFILKGDDGPWYRTQPVSSLLCFNLLKLTGHVMHQQFNLQQLYVLPTLYYVFCIYLRTNSDLCHLQHKLIGFYNRDEKCLLRGTNWVFN